MDTLSKVVEVIEKVLEDNNNISVKLAEDTKLIEDYAIDSITVIEILVMVENKFDISIDDVDLSLSLVDTPKSLSDYVDNKLKIKLKNGFI